MRAPVDCFPDNAQRCSSWPARGAVFVAGAVSLLLLLHSVGTRPYGEWEIAEPPLPPAPPAPLPVPQTEWPALTSSMARYRYVPGDPEKQWVSTRPGVVHAGHICQIAFSSTQLKGVSHWLKYVKRANRATLPHTLRRSVAAVPGRSPLEYHPLQHVQPTNEEQKVLSRFDRRTQSGDSPRGSPTQSLA